MHFFWSSYLPHVVLFSIDHRYSVFLVAHWLELASLPNGPFTHKAQEGIIRSVSWREQSKEDLKEI